MKIENLKQAQEYLNQYIPQGSFKFPGDVGIKRTKYLLNLIDNPQNKIKVIHIAGTSGKGSTAYYTSHILQCLGFKTGLHVSPHLVDVRERFQINNQLINERDFCNYLQEIIPMIEKVSEADLGRITFFEVTVALVYYIFWKEHVDYAVVETGLGGLYDATNVVDSENKLAVITKIGFDHTEILGDTLYKIAAQKAGIIQKRNTVITIWQDEEAMKVIEEEVQKKNGKLYIVSQTGSHFFSSELASRHNFGTSNSSCDHSKNRGLHQNYLAQTATFDQNVSPYFMSHDNKETLTQFLTFHFSFLDKSFDVKLREMAEYQIENCSLALASAIYLSERDKFGFDIIKVTDVLKKVHFKGRMDVYLLNELDSVPRSFSSSDAKAMEDRHSSLSIEASAKLDELVPPNSLAGEKVLVIDGAHNPQKMEAFSKSLITYFPYQKFTLLLAMKSGKDYKETLKHILPYAEEIVITSYNIPTKQGMAGVVSEDPEILKYKIVELGYENIRTIPDIKEAYKYILQKQNNVVITGSLYLVSEVYPYLKS
ncbi:MAG TPA: Mur ligase family protein [Candidatus Nitrosocosmicus sp.]|nr:Mur ligase family protein [Candidatus Nitrosocosmicus sp.]